MKKSIKEMRQLQEDRILNKYMNGTTDDMVFDYVLSLLKKFRDSSDSREKLECILNIILATIQHM